MLNKREQNEIWKLISPVMEAIDIHLDDLIEDEPSNIIGLRELEMVRRDLKSFQYAIMNEFENEQSSWQFDQTCRAVKDAMKEFNDRIDDVLTAI